MDRKDFLALMGAGSAALLASACLGGCAKQAAGESAPPPPANVDFTIDLTQAAYAPLQRNGGYVYANGILIARTLAGNLLAVQQYCTHQQVTLVYQGNQQRFYCGGHQGTFSEAGLPLSGPVSVALRTYTTQVNGNLLRVYT